MAILMSLLKAKAVLWCDRWCIWTLLISFWLRLVLVDYIHLPSSTDPYIPCVDLYVCVLNLYHCLLLLLLLSPFTFVIGITLKISVRRNIFFGFVLGLLFVIVFFLLPCLSLRLTLCSLLLNRLSLNVHDGLASFLVLFRILFDLLGWRFWYLQLVAFGLILSLQACCQMLMLAYIWGQFCNIDKRLYLLISMGQQLIGLDGLLLLPFDWCIQ